MRSAEAFLSSLKQRTLSSPTESALVGEPVEIPSELLIPVALGLFVFPVFGHSKHAATCSVLADLSLLEKPFERASLNGLVRIESERYHKASGKTEHEIRYYITSLKPDARRLNLAIRQHWGIENKLYWVLDVDFDEDLCRKRAGHAAENFSVLQRIALNILKQDKISKRSIKGKRLHAAWNCSYLLKLLGV